MGPTVQVSTALTTIRRTADQAGLDQASRRANLHGAMRVTDPRRVRGRHVLVVDDVLTSGATLAEAHRAVLAAGAADVRLAVAMVTPRRSSAVHLSFRPRSD